MSGLIPKEKLTAYERWELAAFDEVLQETALATDAALTTAATEAIAHREVSDEINQDSESVAAIALPTAADIAQMHDDAQQQGYAAGFSAGHKEGLEQAISASLRINSVLTQLEQALTQIDQKIADQLLATAITLAQQMVCHSLRLQPELILPVVKEAINVLHPHNGSSGHPHLFVHPDDAAIVSAQLAEQLKQHNWRLIEDATLTPGGCRIEYGAGEVDATYQTRWRRVLESIGVTPEWLVNQP